MFLEFFDKHNSSWLYKYLKHLVYLKANEKEGFYFQVIRQPIVT